MATINSFTKLEVNTASQANNLIKNQGAFGFWQWTKTGEVYATAGGYRFVLTTPSAGNLISDYIAITAGQYAALQVQVRTLANSRAFTAKLYFYNASNVQVGSTATLISTTATTTPVTYSPTPVVAPATATKMRLEFDSAIDADPLGIGQIMLVKAATSGAAAAAAVYPPDNWINILGSGLSITTEGGNEAKGVQDILTAGFLTAVITDPALDPATAATLRKGSPIRLQATASGTKGVWQGAVETADTIYEDNKSGPIQRRISITAIDPVRALDNAPAPTTPTGAFAGQVAAAAYAARLPTSDGSSTPIAGTGIEARDDSATATDWIRRACNTHTGVVYVDQFGQIQQRLVSALATTAAYTFSDNAADTGAIFYTKIGLNYGSRSFVNDLTVKRINVDEVEDGSKVYGPYAALDSQVANDRIADEIEITSGSPATLAAAILPVYATPKIFPTEIKVNALDNLAKVLSVQKYDPVRVKRSTLFDGVVRVLKIRHEINAAGGPNREGTWFTYFTVRPLETATAVTVTNPAAGADTGPGDLDTGSGTGFPRIGSVARTGASAAFNFTTSGTTYKIPFAATDVELSDGLEWDDANDQFVVTRAGRYQGSGSIGYATNATGIRGANLVVAGTAKDTKQLAALPSNATVVPVSRTLKLAVGDTVSLSGFQSSGGSLAISNGANVTYLALSYVGP